MLCLSFYDWRFIDAGEKMISALFLGKTVRDRAPGRFADFLFAPKHEKADVLLTKIMGPVRRSGSLPSNPNGPIRGSGASMIRDCKFD